MVFLAFLASWRETGLKDIDLAENAVSEELNHRIDETNKRLDRLYEVIVRRDEHAAIVIKINELDHEVREIKQRLAA